MKVIFLILDVMKSEDKRLLFIVILRGRVNDFKFMLFLYIIISDRVWLFFVGFLFRYRAGMSVLLDFISFVFLFGIWRMFISIGLNIL